MSACLKYGSGDEGQACGLSFVKEGEQEVAKIDSEFFLKAINQQIAERAVSGYQDYGLALPLDNLVQQEDTSLELLTGLIDVALKGSDNQMLFFQYKGRVFGVSDSEEFKRLLSDLRNGSIKNPDEPLSPPTTRPDTDPVDPPTSGHFRFDMTIHANTPASQVEAYKKAAEGWEKIITGHEKINGSFSLKLTVAPERLNPPETYDQGWGGVMANAFVHGCHHQTSAARDGSIKTDEEMFKNLGLDQTGRVWVAGHEIGHLLIHQAISHDAWWLDKWRNPRQWNDDYEEGYCVTDHYFRSGTDGTGYDYFIGPKTVAYFNALAERKGWSKDYFRNGVSIRKDGHPAGPHIDRLAPERGIFGDPKAAQIEEYLLYMLEDIGYTVNWNAPRSLVSQEHSAYYYNSHTSGTSHFDVVLTAPDFQNTAWQGHVVRGAYHQNFRGK
jgi:hypothetical protein